MDIYVLSSDEIRPTVATNFPVAVNLSFWIPLGVNIRSSHYFPYCSWTHTIAFVHILRLSIIRVRNRLLASNLIRPFILKEGRVPSRLLCLLPLFACGSQLE